MSLFYRWALNSNNEEVTEDGHFRPKLSRLMPYIRLPLLTPAQLCDGPKKVAEKFSPNLSFIDKILIVLILFRLGQNLLMDFDGKAQIILYCQAVSGHFLDPPGNHPRGAIFSTVDPS